METFQEGSRWIQFVASKLSMWPLFPSLFLSLFISNYHYTPCMATQHILYLPRSDKDKEYILVNVSSEGPSPLDLKLLATEGEFPYVATSEFRIFTS